MQPKKNYITRINSPLNPTISSVSVLQISAVHTESLVEGVLLRKIKPDEVTKKYQYCHIKIYILLLFNEVWNVYYKSLSVSTLHTAHCTLHSAQCTLHTAQCTLHTEHCTLHTAHCTCAHTLSYSSYLMQYKLLDFNSPTKSEAKCTYSFKHENN